MDASKPCSYWGIFNMNHWDAVIQFCLMKSSFQCAEFLCMNTTSICRLWARGFASTVLVWADRRNPWSVFSKVHVDWGWENWDTLQTMCCHSAISVLSYIKMQNHEWQNALLAGHFIPLMLGLCIWHNFHLNIKLKLKCSLSHRFSFKTLCINISFHFFLTGFITNPLAVE